MLSQQVNQERAQDLIGLLEVFKRKQKAIKAESRDDEAAWEYSSELQSIIDVIERGGTFLEVEKACAWVGEDFELNKFLNQRGIK